VSFAKAKAGFIEPMFDLAVTKLPEGPAWAYELKFDGYRALGLKAAGRVRLLSRNGKDFTKLSLRSRTHSRHSLTRP
jgi:ATP-dependent DNA ligase